MIRVTFDLLPGGDAARARTIGLMEICNIGGTPEVGEYAVVLKKTPPWAGALKAAWKKGKVTAGAQVDGCRTGEDEEDVVARVSGHHRSRRGVYDLVYSGLVACGLGKRNPNARAP
jgi:hypothetical protein